MNNENSNAGCSSGGSPWRRLTNHLLRQAPAEQPFSQNNAPPPFPRTTISQQREVGFDQWFEDSLGPSEASHLTQPPPLPARPQAFIANPPEATLLDEWDTAFSAAATNLRDEPGAAHASGRQNFVEPSYPQDHPIEQPFHRLQVAEARSGTAFRTSTNSLRNAQPFISSEALEDAFQDAEQIAVLRDQQSNGDWEEAFAYAENSQQASWDAAFALNVEPIMPSFDSIRALEQRPEPVLQETIFLEEEHQEELVNQQFHQLEDAFQDAEQIAASIDLHWNAAFADVEDAAQQPSILSVETALPSSELNQQFHQLDGAFQGAEQIVALRDQQSNRAWEDAFAYIENSQQASWDAAFADVEDAAQQPSILSVEPALPSEEALLNTQFQHATASSANPIFPHHVNAVNDSELSSTQETSENNAMEDVQGTISEENNQETTNSRQEATNQNATENRSPQSRQHVPDWVERYAWEAINSHTHDESAPFHVILPARPLSPSQSTQISQEITESARHKNVSATNIPIYSQQNIAELYARLSGETTDAVYYASRLPSPPSGREWTTTIRPIRAPHQPESRQVAGMEDASARSSTYQEAQRTRREQSAEHPPELPDFAWNRLIQQINENRPINITFPESMSLTNRGDQAISAAANPDPPRRPIRQINYEEENSPTLQERTHEKDDSSQWLDAAVHRGLWKASAPDPVRSSHR